MKTKVIISVFLLCATVFLAADRDEAKYTDEAEKTAKQLQERIHAEVKTLTNHAWAGEYYSGDGLGVNVSLLLAPKAGYVFEWHGCLGLYDRNYGGVSFTNGKIHLSFTFKNEQKGFQGIAEQLIPVSWGERQYLIPSGDIVEFCNDVNAGTEPREDMHGRHLLREGDEKKKVRGFPAVPDEFRAYLLTKPIEATITTVGSYTTRPIVCEWKFKDTPVTLDAGSEAGILPGMEFHVRKPGNIVKSVTVTKVSRNSSEALMTGIGEEDPGPKVGWRVSTRFR